MIFRIFSMNGMNFQQMEAERLRKSEILKVRNEAKKMIHQETLEIEEAKEQGLLTLQEISENVKMIV